MWHNRYDITSLFTFCILQMQNLNEVKLYTSFYQSGNLITPGSLWECTMHAWSFNPQVIKIYFLVVLPRQLSGDENTYTNQLGDIVLMHGQILRTNANLNVWHPMTGIGIFSLGLTERLQHDLTFRLLLIQNIIYT